VHLLLRLLLHKDSSSYVEDLSSSYFRQPPRAQGDRDGIVASIVLVPVLLEGMSLHSSDDGTKWQVYAQTVALALLLGGHKYVLCVLIAALSWNNDSRALTLVGFFISLDAFLPRARSLHTVFTVGEWKIVASLLSIGMTEFLFLQTTETTSLLYQRVAVAGLMGSGIAFGVVENYVAPVSSYHSFVARIAVLAAIPLATVELTLLAGKVEFVFPRSLTWLLHFLLDSEEPLVESFAPVVPRYYWLVYWVLILAVTLPLAPTAQTTHVVIGRKWFHMVAVLLFAPVTAAAPMLQSLAYAIATALLLLMECSGLKAIPAVHDFYQRYLDPTKDNGTTDTLVLSHVALVAGCAGPLWISECVLLLEQQQLLSLSLLGVVILGVGDAMGACVGKTFGRTEWGTNHRTVEGSLAMGVSLYLLVSWWVPWQVVFFVTLLEAFTLQLDNLVLPLAGAAVLLLMT
jgi:dolichol kinase